MLAAVFDIPMARETIAHAQARKRAMRRGNLRGMMLFMSMMVVGSKSEQDPSKSE